MKEVIMKKTLILSAIFCFSAQAGTPIIGGTEVLENDPIAAVTVGITFKSATGSRSYCSGTLINDSAVVTAAHCVEDVATAKIVFYRTDILSHDEDQDGELIRTVQKIQIGSGLPPLERRERNEYNDLALLTFNGGLPQSYKAAKYFEVDEVQFEKIVGNARKMVIAGYGRVVSPFDERGRPVPPPPSTPGKKPIQNLKKTNVELTQFRPNGITFGVFGIKTSTCSGDSGGPAFVVINGDYYLVGVLSRGDCYNSSLYTRFTGKIDQ